MADPFDDLDALRCDQTFERSGTAIKQITRVPVRTPKKLDWYRVNPDPAYMMQVHLLENKDETETYLVTPSMATELDGEPTLHRYMLFTAVNRNKTVFIFHVQMQEPDGKWNSWHRSQYEAAEFGMKEWARMISNKDIGGYDLLKAPPG